MNFGTLLKAVDAVMALTEAARRIRGGNQPSMPPPSDPGSAITVPAATGLAGQIEARLTNVVVAALKEAFDRDHARLALERNQLDEQQRRAQEAMRHELQRQATERELGRLRLLAGTAMVGWIVSLALLAWRSPLMSTGGRIVLAAGWVLLLAALGSAFSAMARAHEARSGPQAPMWLLLCGLAATALSILL